MKAPYVADLAASQPVTATFLVLAKEVRQKKSGEPYLSLTLGDRTGDIDAKMWDNIADVVETFGRDDFVRVKGLVQVYQNKPQITLHKLLRVDEREVDFTDFFPASKRDREEMFAELEGIVAKVGNPHLKALLESFLADPDIARRYRTAPAAKMIHHAYLGGLIEHVLSLAALARTMAAHYPHIDLDLLMTGVILHDIGKISELSYERGFTYSDDGQLLGHIVIGLRMLDEKIRAAPDFPPRLRTLVEHMILSHHGELEFGSPKLPLFAEALLLHHLDNLDSKLECMRSTAEKDHNLNGNWTSYSSALDRIVLKKGRFLNPAAEPPPARPAPAAAPAPRSGSLFGEKLNQALKKET
ncbi:MAG: HD domain-containing protein [Acidobacteria bacterium]|nr:HD domain-containing protein [Acidobacteriota bacterium]